MITMGISKPPVHLAFKAAGFVPIHGICPSLFELPLRFALLIQAINLPMFLVATSVECAREGVPCGPAYGTLLLLGVALPLLLQVRVGLRG